VIAVSGVLVVLVVVAGLLLAGVFSSPTSGNVSLCRAFQKFNADFVAKRHVDAQATLDQIRRARPKDSTLSYVAAHVTGPFGDQIGIPAINNQVIDVSGICARYGVHVPSPTINDQ
jgi:hypothetical protein